MASCCVGSGQYREYYGVGKETEDLSDTHILIFGSEGCRAVEESRAVDEHGNKGMRRLVYKCVNADADPEIRETILKYFSEYSAGKKKELRTMMKAFRKEAQDDQERQRIDKLMQVMEE